MQSVPVRRPLSLLLAIASVVPGCVAFRQGAQEVTIREPGTRTLSAPVPARPEAIKDLEFAWLSEAAYGKTTAGKKAKEDLASGKANHTEQPCPDSREALSALGWKLWPNFPSDGLLQKIESSHLRVEVWTRADPPAVAVAFGGTVFNNQNDWMANLRWFLPKWVQANRPDEYSQTVQIFAPDFVQEFKSKLDSGDPAWAFLRSATMYSTGHSLGGGLAQQFAYALTLDPAVPRVSHVYAFDPSPVTGFYSVDVALRDQNRQGLYIDRIYERGEILAIVRSFTSFLVQPSASNATIRGVRYSLFYPANPISGHTR